MADPHPLISSPPELSNPEPSSEAAKTSLRPRKLCKAAPSSDTSTARALAVRVLPRPLSTDSELASAIRHLRSVDPSLARVMDAYDPPTFRSPHPPFHSLVRSILHQQLAYKSYASIYDRFLSLCGGEAGVLPETILALAPHQLRQIGISLRKASYLHDLASKYASGILSDAVIVSMDDRSLFTMLTMVKGIGAWSVHMFMIYSLHRPDVLPVGDLGFRKGVQMLYCLAEVPRPSQMEQLCEHWRPFRSLGAFYTTRLSESKSSCPLGGAMENAIQAVPPREVEDGVEPDEGILQGPLMDSIQMLPNIR